jgi:hypothetical protein
MSPSELKAINAALTASGSEHASLFTSLIDDCKISYYNRRYPDKRNFGPSSANHLVWNTQQTPTGLRKLSIKEVQEICLRELPQVHESYNEALSCFNLSNAGEDALFTAKVEAGTKLINALTDATSGAAGAVTTFPSETFEDIWDLDWEPPDGYLAAKMTTCTLLPNDTLLPLQHSNEGTTLTTLVAGSVTWVVWPSTEHNLGVLEAAYDGFAQNFDHAQLDVTGNLQGGMIFPQKEGQTVRLPPHCPMMALATKNSGMVSYTQMTQEDFMATLRKLPLLKAWFQTEIDGARKQSDFNAFLIRHLDAMLNGHEDCEEAGYMKLTFKKGGPLDMLLRMWDDIKGDLAAILGPADHEAIASIWGDFLIEARGRNCIICKKECRNKLKLMKQHFEDAHWPNAKTTKRIDSMDVDESNEKVTVEDDRDEDDMELEG